MTQERRRWYRRWYQGRKGLVKERHNALRKQLLEMFGARCACCAEDTPEFLALDHKYNDGNVQRKKFPGVATEWRYIVSGKLKKGDYQLLCHNCNMAKAVYKICPHKGNQ